MDNTWIAPIWSTIFVNWWSSVFVAKTSILKIFWRLVYNSWSNRSKTKSIWKVWVTKNVYSDALRDFAPFLENVKNTHGEVLILVKLGWKPSAWKDNLPLYDFESIEVSSKK